MNAQPSLIRICPNCGSSRPVAETICESPLGTGECGWPLFDVPVQERGGNLDAPLSAVEQPAAALAALCANGHPVEDGDQFCLVCGSEAAAQDAPATAPGAGDSGTGRPADQQATAIDGWLVLETLPAQSDEPWDRYLVGRDGCTDAALLTLYRPGAEPDPAVNEALRKMPTDHVPQVFATGRFEGRAYDVVEYIRGGSLAELGFAPPGDGQRLRTLVDELGRALAGFTEAGLRHRDLRPATVLVRTRETFDLVVVGFGSARLSDFDLEAVSPLRLTRYSAPEAVVGAVSAASDWWSLGMIALEQATRGECFAGVNDKAFLLHIVTRGMALPGELETDTRLLLRGLLARDPLRRWSWPEIQAWLRGEPVEAPDEGGQGTDDGRGPAINLNGRDYRRPEAYALAASEAANWAAGREATLRGALATWLDECGADARTVAEVRRTASDEGMGDDFRHALAMMAVNRDLPLAVAGEIVTPAWLFANPETGYDIVTGEVARHLERMGREPWLVRLRTRAEAVRARARLLEVELDETRLRIALLATSRANLEAERDRLRRLFPDTDHPGLASVLERPRLSDEDLIVLVGAAFAQYVPLAPLVEATTELAQRTAVPVDHAALPDLLSRPRREIFAQVDGRVANFARCGMERIDEWADAFRVERRMPLPRAAVLLAVPAERWAEPPKQQYVANLLDHFEKRVSSTVGRGPLVRFTIGKTTPRIDLVELGTARSGAEALVNHVLSRSGTDVPLDPDAYMADDPLGARLRRLVNHASTFRRDTGIDGRYLGFPFLVTRDGRARSDSTRPRIAPVLLWPVAFAMPPGFGQAATLAFDRERDEVRLNPALEGLLGTAGFARWKSARDDLLARSGLRVPDVIDVFAHLAPPRGRALCRLPGKDAKLAAGASELVPAAALFNAEFTGQAVAEDLRQARGRPISGTALDAALQVTGRAVDGAPANPSERERYATVESDPSQDDAVLRSRSAPGLLVEGPPGTGKSQTIVNIVADALGHGQTVLVVCQKQAALNVVKKRLDAEGLGDRLFLVIDVNRDRTAIANALRNQVASVLKLDAGASVAHRRLREERAGRIEVLERDIDGHHRALHAVDDVTGLSYRGLLGALIGVEQAGRTVEAVRLRPLLGNCGRGRLSATEQDCGPLAQVWLQSRFERSPLAVLRPFHIDDAVERELRADLAAFIAAERARGLLPKGASAAYETDDPATLRAWIERDGAALRDLSDSAREKLAAWLDLFRRDDDGTPLGGHLVAGLTDLAAKLRAVDGSGHDGTFFEHLCSQSDKGLDETIGDARVAEEEAGFLGWLNPFRWLALRRTHGLIGSLGLPVSGATIERLRKAAELEARVRPLRRNLGAIQEALRLPGTPKPSNLGSLKLEANVVRNLVTDAQAAAGALFACPARGLAEVAAKVATRDAYERLLTQLSAACARAEAKRASLAALDHLSAWFDDAWVEACRGKVDKGSPTDDLTAGIVEHLGSAAAYQRFRARAATLPELALRAFGVLRGIEASLDEVPASELDGVVRRTIRREALLAAKARIEGANPELLYEREEIAAKVEDLAGLDQEMREANKRLLAANFDKARLGTQAAWTNLTRLRGARVLRLREILDQGAEIGLMHLRPIWLMNPDVASRVLPLRAGLFDVVIYDEASQMPVEHAVPTLFRARRAIVVGDEKQMPPSSFFSGGVESDEDGTDDEEPDEAATETERAAFEESWNRREVKDCPDLLQLGKQALPTATLRIHYRSEYRELIGFSNAAYYRNELSVPVRQPEEEVRRARPVEVTRVDGVYEAQTNAAEAERVVQLLAAMWSGAAPDCPSAGVVTFNRKQADLVEDAIERRAAADQAFLAALRRERDRTQNGEDMGFFVKNVENVQGDERDVIVFSTTFGRDARGTFRRNFGVLGQTGGERRLNVAVTRARRKVLLVTSMPVNDVSDWLSAGRVPDRPRDYLQAYLDYAAKVDAGDFDAVRNTVGRLSDGAARGAAGEVASDGFTLSVGAFLKELGYDPVPASEMGDAFSIDYAIAHPATRLFGIGVECDSPKHPLLERARAREIWRPAVLRRAVPAVHRVSSRDWYHRPQQERARLREAVQAAVG